MGKHSFVSGWDRVSRILRPEEGLVAHRGAAAEVVGEITRNFASFWESECVEMKERNSCQMWGLDPGHSKSLRRKGRLVEDPLLGEDPLVG